MAILTLLLGLILLSCGFGGLVLSINLIPTEMGMLYAVSGVIFLSAGAVVLAIAALIARLDRIVAPPRRPRFKPAPSSPAPEAPTTPSPPEDEVNVNRSGRLPSLRAIEEAIAEPEAPPQVVGRYTAGGAKYMIFSDGAIEAETDDGAFRFASMAEFKSYIAGRQT
jgi:hypothetical protein